uniref:Protein ENL n=1 Tax=Nippostrongylus brasiliensis TaxID=27835 RepID=A0A0N4XJB4_NIPBR
LSLDEKTAPVAPQTPVESFLGKRAGRGKPSKKKKKKRKRHSSESSSSCSSSNSSLNVGEYLRVEKKESTKYISREREGLQKTIVEEIKTVTKKKKYRVTEAKRSDVKPMSGLQMISSDESSEQADGDEVKEEKEKNSSSTDSESEKVQKKEKKNDILSASSSLHDLKTHSSSKKLVAPPPPPPPAPSSLFMSPTYPATNPPPKVAPGLPPVVVPPPSATLPMAPGPSMVLPPTHLPPPFPMPPAAVGRVAVPPPHFNPLLPPPVFPLPHPSVFPPPSPAPAPKRDLPKVSLRFVDDSAPTTSKSASAQSQQTLADRVASIFGGDKALTPSGSAQDEPSTSQRPESTEACEDIDDMDVDVGSSISPPPESSLQSASDAIRKLGRKGHRKGKSSTSDREKKRFLKKVALVCEATEKAIGEEIVDVITKDFYKRIEGVSFEILEEVLAEIRHELEEQKRNEAQEALRAQAQLETQEKPSDVSQLCNPLAASLNDTPEKLGNFPFTINMPKLPSFKRKVRPPSPESDSSDSPVARRRSASEEESDSDDSGAAHKSSSSSQASESSDEVVVTRRKKR